MYRALDRSRKTQRRSGRVYNYFVTLPVTGSAYQCRVTVIPALLFCYLISLTCMLGLTLYIRMCFLLVGLNEMWTLLEISASAGCTSVALPFIGGFMVHPLQSASLTLFPASTSSLLWMFWYTEVLSVPLKAGFTVSASQLMTQNELMIWGFRSSLIIV